MEKMCFGITFKHDAKYNYINSFLSVQGHTWREINYAHNED